MEGDATQLGPSGTQKPQYRLTRKRRHNAGSEELSEPIRKSPRLRKKLIKRRRNAEGEVQPQPSRTSPRLREIQHANQQQAVRTGKPGGTSLRTARTRRRIGPGQPELSPTNPKAQKDLKRRRNIEDGDISNHTAKRSKHDNGREFIPGISQSKDKFIKAWLSSTDDENPLGEFDRVTADNMALPLLDDSGASTAFTSSSRRSEKSSVGPYDSDFRKSLSYRNIYVERKKPPVRLVRRAREIIMRSRSSPEVDEAAAEEVADTARELQTEAEEDIIQQLAPSVIPGMNKFLDRRLASSAGHQWTNFVPVPLDPSIVTNPLPLSKPKPDKAFGYSEEAFTRNQLATIDLLTNATPDKEVHFPFIGVEFKSQAKGGTHYIGTNQAANAGAVVGHGLVELARLSSGLESLDYNEPQFFSLSMDHASVHVNVHWLSIADEGGQICFHVERLSLHDLRDSDDLRAVQRTTKNIFDWGRGERLQMICKQLDAYREKVERAGAERVAAAASESASVDELRNGQKLKGRKRKNSTITVTTLNVEDKPPTIRAPPLVLQSARALSEFIPDLRCEQSTLRFNEGETIEFVNAKAVDGNGWLRGRIKGGNGRWGWVPVAYLELQSGGQTEGRPNNGEIS